MTDELLELEYKEWTKSHTSKKSKISEPFPDFVGRRATKGMAFLHQNEPDVFARMDKVREESKVLAQEWLDSTPEGPPKKTRGPKTLILSLTVDEAEALCLAADNSIGSIADDQDVEGILSTPRLRAAGQSALEKLRKLAGL